MTPAEADRQNVEEFASESANLLRRALDEAARRRADEWARIMAKPLHIDRKPKPVPKAIVEPKAAEPKVVKTKVPKPKLDKRNTRRTVALHEVDGDLKSLHEWCEIYGINKATLASRLNTMSLEEALKKPVRVKYRA